MDNFSFGLAMTVVGMGGTLLSLWLLTLFMRVLKAAFPVKPSGEEESGQGGHSS